MRYSSAFLLCTGNEKRGPANTAGRQGTGSDGEFTEISKPKSEIADLQINLQGDSQDHQVPVKVL